MYTNGVSVVHPLGATTKQLAFIQPDVKYLPPIKRK